MKVDEADALGRQAGTTSWVYELGRRAFWKRVVVVVAVVVVVVVVVLFCFSRQH